jgi:cytochrome c553
MNLSDFSKLLRPAMRFTAATVLMGVTLMATQTTVVKGTSVLTGKTIPSAEVAAQQLTMPNLGGNVSLGLKTATQKCQACHGVDGNTANFKDYPKLSGQLQGYLYLQLVNFATGERKHPIMSPMVTNLDNEDFLNLSAHYSGQNRAPEPPVPAAQTAVGKQLFNEGARTRGIPACAWCHGATAQGNQPVFAHLAGQHPSYLVGMIKLFKAEEGFKNPYAYVMKAAVYNLTDAEIDLLALYLSTLPIATK